MMANIVHCFDEYNRYSVPKCVILSVVQKDLNACVNKKFDLHLVEYALHICS